LCTERSDFSVTNKLAQCSITKIGHLTLDIRRECLGSDVLFPMIRPSIYVFCWAIICSMLDRPIACPHFADLKYSLFSVAELLVQQTI